MKLRHAFLILMVLPVIHLRAEDSAPANNVPTAGVTTNLPAKNGTNEIAEPEAPGKVYTNSAGMMLLQMPGGFWAGKFEVKQSEYEKVVGANPSAFQDELKPVDSVSWNDAMSFCEKMTALDLQKKFLPKGYHYTLPTEDEWQSLVADATLDDAVTSLNGTSRASSSDVGSLGANSLGLYDIRGNVMEFCLCDASQPFRYLKGGSWKDFVDVNLRPEFRWYCKPDETMDTFGFRCLLKTDN